jgi:CBS domain-containing protein
MLKAYEVMTRALATCTSDASVYHVANMMRERDIGDVLVVDDGKLRGIVTDRDLALKALTGEDNPLETAISRFMSTKIVTGEAEWSLEQVARTMGKHQIRRLPIVQDGQVVGIISLGDLALYEDRKEVVNNSLQAISAPIGISAARHSGHSGAWISYSLATLATMMMAWLTWNHSGQALRKQVAKSDLYHSAQKAVVEGRKKVDTSSISKSVRDLLNRMTHSEIYATAQHAASDARGKIDEAASSKSVRKVQKQLKSNFNNLYAQMPTLEYKAPKHKFSFFGL